jgi:hypothetical protein
MMDVSSFDFGKDGATRLAASGAPKDPLAKAGLFLPGFALPLPVRAGLLHRRGIIGIDSGFSIDHGQFSMYSALPNALEIRIRFNPKSPCCQYKTIPIEMSFASSWDKTWFSRE